MNDSLSSLVAAAEGIGLAEAAKRSEEKYNGLSREEIHGRMREALAVMRQSAEKGFDPKLHSMSGMTGGQAARLQAAVTENRTAGGTLLGRAAARALAIAECNAATSMEALMQVWNSHPDLSKDKDFLLAMSTKKKEFQK